MAKKAKVYKADYEKTAKSTLLLVIVFLSLAVLLFFYSFKDQVIAAGNFPLFITLVIIGLLLLIGLVYLVSSSKSSSRKKR